MRITIRGTLVGHIWKGATTKRSKEFAYAVKRDVPHIYSRMDRAYKKITGDFKEHLARIVSDGAFYDCKIHADAVIEFEGETVMEDHRMTTWKRVYNIAEFPSAKDFVTTELWED